MQQWNADKRTRVTVGVVAGWQVYEGTLHSFFGPLFSGVQLAAEEHDCNLMIACGVSRATSEGIIPPIRPAWPVLAADADFVPVGPWNADGLIVVTPLISHVRSDDVRQMIERGYPIVFVGTGEQGTAVVPDNEGGVGQAVAHLAEHGHRRIAFFAGEEGETGDAVFRLNGYRAAVRKYGLATDAELVVRAFNTTGGGQAAVKKLLSAGIPFTAVVTGNDESAFGAIRALKAAGKRVPEDVAVIGFDDRLEAMAQDPPLTTVHYPSFESGYRALEMLLRLLRGEVKVGDVETVPVELAIRRSCGCSMGAKASATPAASLPKHRKGWSKEAIRRQLVQAMIDLMLKQRRQMGQQDFQIACQQLVDGFVHSLASADKTEFQAAVADTVRRVEAVGDSLHSWQAAISLLAEGAPRLVGRWRWAQRYGLAQRMLHQARATLSETTQQRYVSYLIAQSGVENQVGWMTTRLLAALDEDAVLQVLLDALAGLEIGHATVGFFAAEGDDPVAWTTLSLGASAADKGATFPSREFPPPNLYLAERRFNVALLPLVVREDAKGFIAFDITHPLAMGLCAAVTRKLTAALKSARLYRDAIEGQRLAEEASRLKGRFLSTVSHELRTPLNLVVGLSEMLLREEEDGVLVLPARYRQDLERIRTGAQHLDGLIRDVLDLARSEAGRLQLTCEVLDFVQVLQAVEVVGEELVHKKGLEWRLQITGTPPQIWGDRTRLQQVMINLITNAVKFTTRGYVQLAVDVGEENIRVTLSDTGMGIPADEQLVIFDEFRQSERTTGRGYGGMGLGLAICRRLVQLHGGDIWVESSGEEGAGSSFSFTLPIAALPIVEGGAGTREQTVLLLTERVGGSERLEAYLDRQGFQVEKLLMGEATDWLSQLLLAPPGAMVLDIGPESDRGWEVLKVLKGNPVTREIPVLFCSLAEEHDSGQVLELDYLTKPVGVAELAQVLARQGLETSDEGEEEEGERAKKAKKGKKTVLVVDDEPRILEMHSRVVKVQLPTCQIMQARNGREALEVIEQEQPDLVLLDLIMPELDGFEVLEKMREKEWARDIPVIVLTGQDLTEEDMVRLNRGVAAVLGKGLFSVEETLTHVEAVLARNRRLGNEAQRVVRKAMAYMHMHYTEQILREELADYVGVSEGYLSRCFRREMGLAPMVYLNRYRVKQAKVLLADEEKSVAEVATAVGFSDPAYFSRVFQRGVGMSPSVYRRNRGSI